MEKTEIAISICVVCMNRLHQLQETFIKNITDNEDHTDLEFVLLNYNSQDGMDDWVKANLQHYIASGRVKYYHTTEPKTFSHSHAKNLLFKLAKGDILCNINADHFTGHNFAGFVNETFLFHPECFLTTIDYHKTDRDHRVPSDLFGKVCVWKRDFYNVNGFDEYMSGYGFEDMDFANRIELLGRTRLLIKKPSFLRFITHGNEERYTADHLDTGIHNVLLQYKSPAETDIIILYKSGTLNMGTLIDHSAIRSEDPRSAYLDSDVKFENSLKNKSWANGQWYQNGSGYRLEFEDHPSFDIDIDTEKKDGSCSVTSNNSKFYVVTDLESLQLINEFILFYPNRVLMEKNLDEKIVTINPSGYGKANVFFNFFDNLLPV